MTSISGWVQVQIATNLVTSTSFRSHPGYPAWLTALEELGQAHGYPVKPIKGSTPGYCEQLVSVGADPEQIKATFTLLFL